jgi:Amt family ammonium transporter
MKTMTNPIKRSLLLWLFLIVPLAGFSPGLMAQDAAGGEGGEAKTETPIPAEGGEDGAKTEAGDESSAEETKTEDTQAPYNEFMEGKGDVDFFVTSNLWLLLAAALVFIMHLGFSTLESGLTRSKNTVNVLFKNVFIVCAGIILYAAVGFNMMYPGEMGTDWNGYFQWGSWFGIEDTAAAIKANMTAEYADYTWWTDFIFQAMFAITGATIVSGAVAERVKLPSFMIFVILLVGIAYPISGAWKWGGGFLDAKGYYDFAGSSIVHAFGGFAALACVILLGARKGKYDKDGKAKAIPGHSMPLATIGVFLLFLGWFGFNGGSVLSADPQLVSIVFVTTTLAACAGGLGAIATSWFSSGKPDLSMALNGILAGLVGITAGADVISPGYSILVGLLAGIIVVISVMCLDKAGIDDPVGAISVHGTCGLWGCWAVGLFSSNPAHSLGTQIYGSLVVAGWAFFFSLIVFGAIKAFIGVRVTEEEEEIGLDITEHGQEAYPEFSASSDR